MTIGRGVLHLPNPALERETYPHAKGAHTYAGIRAAIATLPRLRGG